MEETFASLSKRQSMMLLTAVAFKGAESVEAFDHLPDDEAELLKHRAEKLLQIPRDRRIPLLVQEIKRLVTARRRQLGSADPLRLAEVLRGERSAMVEVVLRALPSTIADAVRAELPDRPKVSLQREVRPDVLSIIRWKLEDALKKSVPRVGAFKFSDVLTLQARELLAVCDRMGARSLATAMAGLTDAEREAFFAKLPPDQRALAQRASEAGKARKLTEEDSHTVLKMFAADKSPSLGLRSAGAQRLARACVAQSPEFAARMIERHANELGRLLQRWVKEERSRGIRGDGGRGDIVEQLERLAQRGIVDRPMRLPPPPQRKSKAEVPAAGAGPSPGASVELPGGRLLPPPGRRDSAGQMPQLPIDNRSVVIPVRGPPPVLRPSTAPAGRALGQRDAVAERAARLAGAVTSRPKERDSSQRRRAAQDPRSPVASAPRAQVLKADRGGKLPPPPARPAPGPGLQEFPRRREPPTESPTGGRPTRPGLGRSPVVKGGSRGPGGRSR